ncbi:MAG: hypothetical protein AB8B97_24835 [Granulosicoccus sp.]
MAQQKNNWVQVLVVVALLILTLPLIYMLVSRVLLPLEWDEPHLRDSGSESQ